MNQLLHSFFNFKSLSKKQLIVLLFYPILFAAVSFFYIIRQPEQYRVSINVNLRAVNTRQDLQNIACSTYLASNLFKERHKSVRNADYWLNGLNYFDWLKDYSCFSINTLPYINYYLFFYNTSKLYPVLANNLEFVNYLKSNNLGFHELERKFISNISFLVNQDTLYLTIGLKGNNAEELKFLLKSFTQNALIQTQKDVNNSWKTILTRLKYAEELSFVSNGKKIIEKVDEVLNNEKFETKAPEWKEDYLIERIGPNRIAVVLFCFLSGILFSFFILIFQRSKG